MLALVCAGHLHLLWCTALLVCPVMRATFTFCHVYLHGHASRAGRLDMCHAHCVSPGLVYRSHSPCVAHTTQAWLVLQATFTFVVRSFTVLDGIGKGLDPRFDISEISAPYARGLLLEGNPQYAALLKEFKKKAGTQNRAFR